MVGNAHHLLSLTTQPRYGGATQELKTVSDANSWKDVDKPVATKSARVNHQQELSLCAMNVRSIGTQIAQAGAVQPTTLESTALKTGLQDCVKSQSHRVRREQNGCQRLKPVGALIRNTVARYHQVSLGKLNSAYRAPWISQRTTSMISKLCKLCRFGMDYNIASFLVQASYRLFRSLATCNEL